MHTVTSQAYVLAPTDVDSETRHGGSKTTVTEETTKTTQPGTIESESSQVSGESLYQVRRFQVGFKLAASSFIC